MNPNTQPNTLPSLFDSWQEWRETYAAYVNEYKTDDKNEVRLKIQLRRLGYAGANLDAELNFIKEQG